MNEGMPGFTKVLQLINFLEELELSEEEIAEAHDHWRRADVSHGLLWGDIANFGREQKGMELLALECKIMEDIQAWRKDEVYNVAVVAAGLRKMKEIITDA